jgi:S1-C subfamily serine protease
MIVLSVEQDAPGGKAGVVIGDILVALDGKPVSDAEDIQAVLGADSVGQSRRASMVRGGELRDVNIVVGERPRRRGWCR